MKKLMVVALAFATLMPATASARVVVGIRPMIGFGYGYGYGPYWGGPYWGPAPYYSSFVVSARPSTGAVKFDTNEKSANVFVNDAFVGTVEQVKTLHLIPGTYEIQVTEPGRASFGEKVFVAPGATLKLHPDLPPVTAPAPAPAGF